MNWAYLIALVLIFSCIGYVFMSTRIYLVDKKSSIRRAYFAATFFLAIWSLSYGLMAISDNAESARIFWAVGLVVVCLFLPAWGNFMSKMALFDTKASRTIVYCLYAVAIAISAIVIALGDITFLRTDLGFQFLYETNLISISLIGYILICLAFILFLKYKWLRSTKTKSQKKSASTFIAATLALAPFAIALDFFIPIITDISVPALGSLFIFIIAALMYRSLQENKTFNISVQTISEDMFSLVSQPILALDPDNRVLLFNKTAKDFWAHEISGKNMAELIMVDNNTPEQAFFEESVVYDAAANITVSSAIGTRNCGIMLSVVKDKFNDVSYKILIINDITDMQNTLSEFVSAISSASEQVLIGAKQMSGSASYLSDSSQKQAASVQQLSAAISEIAQMTKGNADMAGQAAALAGDIMGGAEKGSRHMDEMMTAVKEINESSHNISKVIKSIDDIAFQTNILALNAAVEAARAGQHGKGFAVVAEEVRNLAAKSAEAAKNTESLIADSIEKAELGSRIADDTAASLTEIVKGIGESSQLVAKIAKSSEEQSEGIEQINSGIEQVSQQVHKTSEAAVQGEAASREMRGQSDMLEELVSHFKNKDGRKLDSLPPKQASE